MSLLQSSLLLLSLRVLSSWCVSPGTFVVTHSDDVFVREGETVNITCCWTGTFQRFRVNWLKNQTVIRSDYFNHPNASLKKEEKKCSSLNISSVRTEDSGTYICKVTVEIPSLCEAKGNGTVITVKKMGRSGTFVTVKAKKKKDKGNRRTFTIMPKVKKGDNTDQHIAREAPKEEMFTYLMRTLPVLALITAFFWLYYVGTRAQQNSKASSGNKPTSSQKQEQDEEEEERDGRAVEAANEC
ncbi:unnamed protein product [Oreochromis niloticus]|nr:unnamed protein product [Mustela putorius furo]